MISVVGSLVTDIIIHTTKEFKLIGDFISFPFDSKIEIEKIRFDIGGSGHNIAVNLSNLGNRTKIFGKIGEDTYGDLIKKSLKRFRVDISDLKRVKNEISGFSFIFLFKGEKSIITYRGTNNLVGPEDLNEKKMKKSKFFVFTSMTSDKNIAFLKKAINISKKYGIKIVSNPSTSMINYRKEELKNLMKYVDLLILNERESKIISGKRNVESALKFLESKTKGDVIITLGGRGCVVSHNKIRKKIKTYNVKVADTTGAGDSFTAGVVHMLNKGYDLFDSVKFGMGVSSIVIQIEGATTKLPKEDEVIDFLRVRGENFV